ncbi:alpha/beta fold hydrolase [Streptomyces sp. NPDC056291]|uniref:alpha/beta fold hydrolase n=1 Tax=Streptomyces sp. NPDC056291 TaxID=3345772 RepID=UPI0035DE09F8
MAKPNGARPATCPDGWTPVADTRTAGERLTVLGPTSPAPHSGAPVAALVHGLEGHWTGWQPLAGHLGDRCRTYVLDLPWRAGNHYRWRHHGTPAHWLREALAMVPEPVDVLIGHSFGANAVLEHLATSAGALQPRAAVLLAPFFRPATLTVDWPLYDAAFAGFRQIITDGVRVGLGERARRLDPVVLTAMADTTVERIGPVGFLSLFLQFTGTTELDLGVVTVPTLVLAGENDTSLSEDRAAALATAMPAARVRRHPHYTHFCHAEQTAAVGADITAFLTDTTASWTDTPFSSPLSPPFSSQKEPPMTELLDGTLTTRVGRPRYEGANIRTWIGFKHFMYLTEEAILQYFRERGVGAETLYHTYGLGLEIVDHSVSLPATLGIDDDVIAIVEPGKPKPGHGAPFKVRLTVQRDGETVTILTGKIRVALVTLKDAPADVLPVPAHLEPYVVVEMAELSDAAGQDSEAVADGDLLAVLTPSGSNAFLWSWRIPYFYCHFSDRLQHSGYVRAMEEVVDRFLDDRGISIRTMLDERGWIPVVSRARVHMLADAFMEETLHTVFTVQEIIKDVMYTAAFDTYVHRDGRLVHTATGSIMHGYAVSRGEQAGSLAEFDDTTRAALLGGAR